MSRVYQKWFITDLNTATGEIIGYNGEPRLLDSWIEIPLGGDGVPMYGPGDFYIDGVFKKRYDVLPAPEPEPVPPPPPAKKKVVITGVTPVVFANDEFTEVMVDETTAFTVTGTIEDTKDGVIVVQVGWKGDSSLFRGIVSKGKLTIQIYFPDSGTATLNSWGINYGKQDQPYEMTECRFDVLRKIPGIA